MKRLHLLIVLCLAFLFANAQKVISIKVDGSINPASASFIKNGIDKAAAEKAECLIIHLNTPGGLLKSTRVIVSDILGSPIPVIVYVSPSGAHAGSAGVFITMAAHIAAMAPGTNIGAAHPVNMQGGMDSTMANKTTNDAAAFIRSIAEKRNRNLDWAEEAVRNSVSITEAEAVSKRVVDLVAPSEEALLDSINGKSISLPSGTKTLQTGKATTEVLEMSFVERLLDMISDPNVAYILMMLGFYGLLFELYSPGAVAPGVIGGICLILAFYSIHTLPLNYAGLALIIFAILLFVLEVKIVSHGILGIGGVISLALGSMMLIKTDSALEFIRISVGVIISATVLTALFFLFLVYMVVKGQKAKPITGMEGIIGETGEVLRDLVPSGTVRVHGEIWKANALTGNLQKGQRIIVKGIDNLTLTVEQIGDKAELSTGSHEM
ncbi:nodulation protein NfeD [Segetibacter sp. 3557_3]|uniref:NfeD family protein n=1 Tax=Segetibacter sp. 3557_3 TaxID=2547429 RepID=UPI001059058C|nr:nodulation protein NfeD [Segetibacter sp. 3557_3]TDH29193.1 nodulation protein NfeD [Segetibacter sp. 3557_3]